jgi:hypothetical protein
VFLIEKEKKKLTFLHFLFLNFVSLIKFLQEILRYNCNKRIKNSKNYYFTNNIMNGGWVIFSLNSLLNYFFFLHNYLITLVDHNFQPVPDPTCSTDQSGPISNPTSLINRSEFHNLVFNISEISMIFKS